MNMRKCILILVLLLSGCGEQFHYGGTLVVSPENGMANRLKALASGYAVAKATKRKLVIDWHADPEHFPLQFEQLFENKLETLDSELKTQKNAIGWYSWDGKNGSKNMDDIVYDKREIVYVFTQGNIIPSAINSGSWWRDYKEFLRDLKPNQQVRSAIQDFETMHFKNGEMLVGVHYRGWAFTAGADRHWDLRPPGYDIFSNELERTIADYDHNVLFFVATDKPEFIAAMKNKFGSKRVVSRDSNPDRNTLEGLQNALIEWYLLGKTEFVIGTTGSTFSDTASLLTKTGKKINLGENPWGK